MPNKYDSIFMFGRSWEVQKLLKKGYIKLAALDRGALREMRISIADFEFHKKNEKRSLKKAMKWVKRAAA